MNRQVHSFSRRQRRKQIALWAIVFICLFSFLFLPSFVKAAATSTNASAGFLDKIANADCMENGECTLEDVGQGFVELTRLLIGAIGALALVYFIWGGIQWLTSYGNQQKIQKGREIMLQTVIALIVAFMSYILVEFLVNDVLQVKPEVRVNTNTSTGSATNSSSCENKTEGTACNTGQVNYVCSGSPNYQCMTKCELKSSKDAGFEWACGTAIEGDITEPYLCPGGADNICVRGAAK